MDGRPVPRDLIQRLEEIDHRLGGKGVLSEKDVDEALGACELLRRGFGPQHAGGLAALCISGGNVALLREVTQWRARQTAGFAGMFRLQVWPRNGGVRYDQSAKLLVDRDAGNRVDIGGL